MLRSLTNSFLAILLFISLFLIPFSTYARECQLGASSGSVTWDGSQFGDAPYTCAAHCKHVLNTASVCTVSGAICAGEFISNGQPCPIEYGDGIVFGGNTVIRDPSAPPDKPWDPNSPSTMPSKVQNVLNGMPRDTSSGNFQALAYKDMAHIDGMGVMTLDELLKTNTKILDTAKLYSGQMSTMTNAIREMSNLSSYIELNTARSAEFESSSAYSLSQILIKLNELTGGDGGNGGGDSGLPPQQFDDLMGNIGGLHSTIYNASNTVATNVRNVREGLRPIEFGINDTNRKLDSLGTSLTDNANANTDKLLSAIKGIPSPDFSGLESGIGGINSGIDSINTGLDNLNGLLGGNGLTKPGVGSGVNFGEVPLYGSESLDKMTTEITDLQKEYSEKIKDFQKLFSFDTSKLNNGEYKDHSLTFTSPDGRDFSVKSSVFPALVSNASLISSVILFLAALAGLRIVMGGGDK